MSSILDISSCSYAQGALNEIFSCNIGKLVGEAHCAYTSRLLTYRFQMYNEHFGNLTDFKTSYKMFIDKLQKVRERINSWGKHFATDKKNFLREYNLSTWKNLCATEKANHTLFNCPECMMSEKCKTLTKTFPVKTPRGKKNAVTKGIRPNLENVVVAEKSITPEKALETARTVLDNYIEIDQACANSAGKTLTEMLNESSTIPLEKKKTPNEKRNEKRRIKRDFKREIESKRESTAVERSFGNVGLSLSLRKRLRLQEVCESNAECKKRTRREEEERQQNKRARKNHGSTDRWDLKPCVEAISRLPEGLYINFTELARKYKVENDNEEVLRNGGQIIKKALVEGGIDLDKFEYMGKNNELRERRKLNKLSDNISMPGDPTEETVIANLKKKIENGIYSMGEEIVPQTYKRVEIKDNMPQISEIQVSGRKEGLLTIRQKMADEHKEYMRLFTDDQYEDMNREDVIVELKRIGEFNRDESTDELRRQLKILQRTRHLILWHDTSTISNNSHLLMMVKCLYDPAIHYSDEEFKIKNKRTVNVQSEIEKPYIYILARCPPTDDQIKYV